VFGAPAHLGEAPSWITENLRDPGFHAPLGLLYYGITQSEHALPGRRRGGFLANVSRLFASS
jgi:cell division protein FtsA